MNKFQSSQYLLQLSIVLFAFITITVKAEVEYERVARNLHNRYRSRHFVRSLYSSNDLHRRAEKCAQYYANLGSIDHTCPYTYEAGENIWAQWGGDPSNYRIATRSTDSWYEEELRYAYNGYQSGTGHFTQMVWKNSRDFGFGVGRKRNMAVGVALYYPAGNVIGEFSRNVRRRKPK